MNRILIVGIGNVFMGDDAFGVITVRQLMGEGERLPDGVDVRDLGIRSYDLAFAIMEHDITILVDATPHGEVPGTISLIEPTLEELDQLAEEITDGHSMNPLTALQLVRTFGGTCGQLYLVGCEPATLVSDEGVIGLSVPLAAAPEAAIRLIKELLRSLLKGARTLDAPEDMEDSDVYA